jgi:hypothetical protein
MIDMHESRRVELHEIMPGRTREHQGSACPGHQSWSIGTPGIKDHVQASYYILFEI